MFKKSVFVFVILLLNSVYFNFVNAQVAIPQNLFSVDTNTVALWRFNDVSGNTIIDETGINNGTAIGTAIIDGKFGKARYFNGQTDYIIVPDNPSLRNFSQLTIEAWVYPTGFDLSCWANAEDIISKGVDSNYGYINGYNLRIARNQDGSCAGASSFNQVSFSGIWHEPNQWYYVVSTYDGVYSKIYVNGVLESTNYHPNLTFTDTHSLYINHHLFGGGYQSSQRMRGLIDEIRISNIARSAEEIALNYALANQPTQFWSEIQSARLNFRQSAGVSGILLKTLPNGWALKVIKIIDDNGNNIDIDGYRWYQVEDKIDGVIGWMAAKNLTNGTIYLDYNPNNQSDLQNKAETQLDTADKRKPVILDAVNNYYAKNNSENSLYDGGGGRDNKNNFQKFIIDSEFPKELILAVGAEESGPEFNNEICAGAFDGGIGIMQITSPNSKGLGSGLDINSKRDDCKGEEWVGRFSKYYSNALQGIYANIKDGFRVLQNKYDQALRLMANPRIITSCPLTIDGVNLTCADIKTSLIVWGYNGIVKNEKGLYGDYLGGVAIRLSYLNNYFVGIINDANKIAIETLSRKLKTVNNNKILVKLNSPGELQITDSQGRKTGVFDNLVKEEIPFSVYDANVKGAVIFFQNDSYVYSIIGTASGKYGLDIVNAQHGIFSGFSAINLPITEGEIHQYRIDWDALNRGERGVKLNIDYEGDGVIDQTIDSDAELHDIEPPQINVSPIAGEYLLNSQLQIQFSATDKISGIAGVEALLNDVVVNNGQIVVLTKLGLNVLKITAVDYDGNISTKIIYFNTAYRFGGFLSPIKADGSGIYKLRITLPIKFQLTDINNNYISTATAYLYLAKISDGVVGTDEIAFSTSAADAGNTFRYDSENNQYVYNLATDNLSVGSWQFRVVLNDGKFYTAIISLR
ncbi:MAG: LamG-like jellyroll fold domain-containing protein [Patescibacteria group bacterium]